MKALGSVNAQPLAASRRRLSAEEDGLTPLRRRWISLRAVLLITVSWVRSPGGPLLLSVVLRDCERARRAERFREQGPPSRAHSSVGEHSTFNRMVAGSIPARVTSNRRARSSPTPFQFAAERFPFAPDGWTLSSRLRRHRRQQRAKGLPRERRRTQESLRHRLAHELPTDDPLLNTKGTEDTTGRLFAFLCV